MIPCLIRRIWEAVKRWFMHWARELGAAVVLLVMVLWAGLEELFGS